MNVERQINDILKKLDELSKSTETHRQNINLLNSVFSGINKFLTFLYEDSKQFNKRTNEFMENIIEQQKKQSEILDNIMKKLNRKEET